MACRGRRGIKHDLEQAVNLSSFSCIFRADIVIYTSCRQNRLSFSLLKDREADIKDGPLPRLSVV